MATRYTQNATNELAGIYSPQQNLINAQMPANQQLYDTLYQGLDAQQANQTQDIVNSANIRGVGRDRLGQDVTGALGATVDLAKAQLGRQQAGDSATIQGKIADLNVQRINDIQTLSNALQDRAISEGKYKQNINKLNRNYNLEVLKMNRQFSLDQEEVRLKKAAEAAEAARQAAYYGYGGGGGSGGGQQQATRKLTPTERAYAEVGKRGSNDYSDYMATLDSAKRGNWYDKLKIMAYHDQFPGSYGRTVPLNAITTNNASF